MKGALFFRGLRFVHWLHNIYKKIWVNAKKAGRNARQTIVLRKDRRHPVYELVGEENGNDKDNDEWDIDDGDEDTATEDGDEDSDDDATSEDDELLEEEEEENQHLSGVIQTSPLDASHHAALRHRAFSEM